jgi:hypothetical protein
MQVYLITLLVLAGGLTPDLGDDYRAEIHRLSLDEQAQLVQRNYTTTKIGPYSFTDGGVMQDPSMKACEMTGKILTTTLDIPDSALWYKCVVQQVL